MDRRYMVKQWIGEILTERGAWFRVYTAGDDRWYLFDPISPDGISGCIAFPIEKRRLRPGVIPQGLGRALRAQVARCSVPRATTSPAIPTAQEPLGATTAPASPTFSPATERFTAVKPASRRGS